MADQLQIKIHEKETNPEGETGCSKGRTQEEGEINRKSTCLYESRQEGY